MIAASPLEKRTRGDAMLVIYRSMSRDGNIGVNGVGVSVEGVIYPGVGYLIDGVN